MVNALPPSLYWSPMPLLNPWQWMWGDQVCSDGPTATDSRYYPGSIRRATGPSLFNIAHLRRLLLLRAGSAGLLYSRLWFFLISTFSRLIFWFRVESGMRKRSAASVWLQLHFSSMSLMMRRSQSSMISYSEASEA